MHLLYSHVANNKAVVESLPSLTVGLVLGSGIQIHALPYPCDMRKAPLPAPCAARSCCITLQCSAPLSRYTDWLGKGERPVVKAHCEIMGNWSIGVSPSSLYQRPFCPCSFPLWFTLGRTNKTTPARRRCHSRHLCASSSLLREKQSMQPVNPLLSNHFEEVEKVI